METLTNKLYSNVYSPPSKFFQNSNRVLRHVGKRLLHVGFIPSSAIANILDGILGMKDGIKFIFGGASDNEGWESAQRRLDCLDTCLSNIFKHSILALNIYAKFSPEMSNEERRHAVLENQKIEEPPRISMEGYGILTNYFVYSMLTDYALSDKRSMIASNLTFIIMAPTAVLTRITDLAIGILAVVGALCTLGRNPSINHLAFRGLQITGIFHDLFNCGASIAALNS